MKVTLDVSEILEENYGHKICGNCVHRGVLTGCATTDYKTYAICESCRWVCCNHDEECDTWTRSEYDNGVV